MPFSAPHANEVGSNRIRTQIDGKRALRNTRYNNPSKNINNIDVSFISLKLVLPAVARLLPSPARMIALIKPQFEAGRHNLKKGIVRDARIHREVCEDVAALLASLGWKIAGFMPSPILGGDGNREFFIAARSM